MARRDDERLVLGIETSCDETAAAVVRGGRFVLSNVIASQHDLHAEYRGVVPEIASRAHAERITPIVQAALREAGISLGELDAVAMSCRPGLIGSLLVGVSAGKALAWASGAALVGVDHVRAHLVAGLVERETSPVSESQHRESRQADCFGGRAAFPALGLVVSGGHTSVYRLTSSLEMTRLGGTIDDAIGEAYDKVAAVLGLDFPGGPLVDLLAQTPGADERRFSFPVSRLSHGPGGDQTLNFSFSGLKTAVLYAVKGVPGARDGKGALEMTDANKADVCASFQRAAVSAVMIKLERARAMHPECQSLLCGGGVTANSRLRRELTAWCGKHSLSLALPAMEFCLDNAAMIAALGHRALASRSWRGDALSVTASASGTVG